jgi:hypothetical protein
MIVRPVRLVKLFLVGGLKVPNRTYKKEEEWKEINRDRQDKNKG